MNKKLPTLAQRSSGVLLHITSLPSSGPIGRLGADANNFLNFLAAAGQSWWQTLPINPIGKGFSPYSTISSFAGEALLIDLQIWKDSGFLSSMPKSKFSAKTDFPRALREFDRTARHAFAQFQLKQPPDFIREMKAFVRKEKSWLEDYALFASIAKDLGTDWSQWPEVLRHRNPGALRAAAIQYRFEIDFHYFLQFSFELSWRNLRHEASKRGIGLIGDIPIFVAHDSADVWANQKYFCLKADGTPRYVAGVPPDYFNAEGQLWGNALYNWPALKRDGFDFWIRRLRRLLNLYDLIRIDHFIGFFRYWEIPAQSKTAKTGRWMHVPGTALFEKIQKAIGRDRMIAEDLGLLVPGVIKLRDQFHIPGMRVLQFGFGNGGDGAYHMPHQYPEHSIAYTGTHDNDTLTGWYQSAKKEAKKRKPSFNFNKILAVVGNRIEEVHWNGIRAAAMSSSRLAVLQMQDALGLGTAARMNVPGTPKGNWTWRMQEHPKDLVSDKLRAITSGGDRIL